MWGMDGWKREMIGSHSNTSTHFRPSTDFLLVPEIVPAGLLLCLHGRAAPAAMRVHVVGLLHKTQQFITVLWAGCITPATNTDTQHESKASQAQEQTRRAGGKAFSPHGGAQGLGPRNPITTPGPSDGAASSEALQL